MTELNGINVVKAVIATNTAKKIRIEFLNEVFKHLDSSGSDSDEEECSSICTCQKRKYMEQLVSNYNEEDFRQTFRLPVQAFEKLYDDIYGLLLKQNYVKEVQMNLQKQVLAVLWFLSTSDSFSSIEERFNMSKGTLSKVIARIINFIQILVPHYIKWPNKDDIPNIKAEFSRTSKFKQCIGVIDGTYVGCSVPKDQLESYTNRKGFTSVTLQAICDANMKFMMCYSHPSSEPQDFQIFQSSGLYFKIALNPKQYFPGDEYILGDKAFPILPWCIPPYIKDWEEDNDRAWDDTNTLFNEYHSSAWQVIERSFVLLLGRFRRLKFLNVNIPWVSKTILACCVLHNLCLDFDENVEDFMQEGKALREKYIIDDGISKEYENEDERYNPYDTYDDQEGIHQRDLLRSQMLRDD